ncbi:unnamed protein product [Nezara viridula]|uniref:CUB domain-containing protein n=1 Tax=Nezara viridula TaxID=85310 RepID=A0A9P0HDC3_NEZVI|nr:unnamed protein product [Nezara viridula]
MILAAVCLMWWWGQAASEGCGGILTEPAGLIQTPEFPAPFSVPLKCQWLLDSSGLPEADVEIVIYLTQLFVTSGLTFTEYAFYDPLDSSLQRNPSLLLSVTEQNSVITRWLSTRSRFLLIELELDRLEGNHIRALDNLLDVYGFNITYQMVTGPASNTSCSVMDCSFAGNCYISSDYR